MLPNITPIHSSGLYTPILTPENPHSARITRARCADTHEHMVPGIVSAAKDVDQEHNIVCAYKMDAVELCYRVRSLRLSVFDHPWSKIWPTPCLYQHCVNCCRWRGKGS